MPVSKRVISNLNPKKLKQSLLDLPVTAKRKKWKFQYDKLTDALYFTPNKVPQNNVLFSVSKELNIYVNENSKINGIFIENFSSNFIQHNAEFQDLAANLSVKVEGGTYTTKDENKSELYAKALESSLLEVVGEQNELLYPEKFVAA